MVNMFIQDVRNNMLKEFIKYIKASEKQIISGQDKDKMWYCKELQCETVEETKTKISELNKIYNQANEKIIGVEKEKNKKIINDDKKKIVFNSRM